MKRDRKILVVVIVVALLVFFFGFASPRFSPSDDGSRRVSDGTWRDYAGHCIGLTLHDDGVSDSSSDSGSSSSGDNSDKRTPDEIREMLVKDYSEACIEEALLVYGARGVASDCWEDYVCLIYRYEQDVGSKLEEYPDDDAKPDPIHDPYYEKRTVCDSLQSTLDEYEKELEFCVAEQDQGSDEGSSPPGVLASSGSNTGSDTGSSPGFFDRILAFFS